MNNQYWPTKRFLTMNLENNGELALFRAIMDARVSTKTPIVSITMTASANLTHELNRWASRQIERENVIHGWLIPWNPQDPKDRMDDLNNLTTPEKLSQALRRAREAEEEFSTLGIQTGRQSLPHALEDLMEAAQEILTRDPGGVSVQASCRNLLESGQTPDGEIIPVYGNALDIMIHVGETSSPDINDGIDHDEFIEVMWQDKMASSNPGDLPELIAGQENHREMNRN